MTTLFSHFLAQALGCASTENVHNVVRTRLLFTPDHGRAAAAVDDFILNGTEDEADLAFWSRTLSLDPALLRDAATLAARTKAQQAKRLPALQLTGVGTTANLDPQRRVLVHIRLNLEEHPLRDRLDRLGPILQRSTGYTVADLNQAGAFEQILGFANAHWQHVEQMTGARAKQITLELEPEALQREVAI